MSLNYYDLILPVIPKGTFTYTSENNIPAGTRVKVSFGSRIEYGIVKGKTEKINPDISYKNINEILDEEPVFPETYLRMLSKMSNYYQTPLGITMRGVLAKSILSSEKPDVTCDISDKSVLLHLNKHQHSIYESITKIIDNGFSANLLHGITGSGKTEIYIELVKECIKKGKQVIYIVPEISLTPQIVQRLSERLGFSVPVYHSKLSPKRKQKVFWGFNSGCYPLVIGARSALFIPAENIGLIIVDEEHESSFKQEEAPSYQLRDMAVMYANILNIPAVLGSATPSVESYFNALNGKYKYFELSKRFNEKKLPEIKIIDLKTSDILGNLLSVKLYDKIYEKIKQNEQVLLLLNKKGYSKHLICKKCGTTLQCMNCSIALTYYKKGDYAKCSYCGEIYKYFKCSECGENDFLDFGHGTEKAVEILRELFGDTVIKLDTDSVTSQKKMQSILNDFYSGKYNIMVGTQLIAKGFNFPEVTLVGVLNIDNLLSLPDFRANERAYQLLTQVAGRAGRFIKKGEVFIQTYNPEMPVFQLLNSDSEKFYMEELGRRKEHEYPPFLRMVRIIISDTKEERAEGVMKNISKNMNDVKSSETIMLGPSPAPIFKIKNRYRYSLIIKTKNVATIQVLGKIAREKFETLKKGNMQLKIDVDPYFFM